MPYSEYKERGAYYAVEAQNPSQTDVNIARLVMDFHNANFKDRIKFEDVMNLGENIEQEEKQISLNVGQWSSLHNKGVNNG